jgi:hypothetical protein
MEEVFRKQIVKDAPLTLRRDGAAFPLEGWEKIELLVGALCDGCQAVLEPGVVVHGHVRTGRTLCPSCAAREPGVVTTTA